MSIISDAADRLCDKGVVAIVRARSARGGQRLVDVARSLLVGGVDCIEITLNTPGALEAIRLCRRELPGAMIGVGSVLDAGSAAAAIEAGAQFIISPIFDPAIIAKAHDLQVPALAGCFSPTEIHAAAQAGADLVKVFPAAALGPQFIKALLAPMPHLKLAPTGGVDLDSAAEWIKAGAATLCVGSALVSEQAVEQSDFAAIEQLAKKFVQIVAAARGR